MGYKYNRHHGNWGDKWEHAKTEERRSMTNRRQAAALREDSAEKQYFGSYDDRPEDRTITSRARIRNELTGQVQAFLSEGGQIREIERNLRADPPRKPTSSYGNKPI